MSDAGEAGQAREISKIGFPYADLDEAIGVVKAMMSRGGVAMERDQLAAALNMSVGGGFNNKLSAAKQFGLVDSSQGKWQITPLGFLIIDPSREAAAKAEAFLNVELYKRTYDEFRGKQLPPKAGLEHAFVSFGVAFKQRDKARQTFERSARSAGYFPNASEDRLVMPVVEALGFNMESPPDPAIHGSPLASSPPPPFPPAAPDLDPLIQGLLNRLPKAGADTQTAWGTPERLRWLQAAAQIFDLLYSEGTGRIVVSVEREDR